VKSLGASYCHLGTAIDGFILILGKFIPTRRTPGVSTSDLLERIVSGYRNRDFDDKLVRMGHAELRAEGSDYDSSSRHPSRFASRSTSPTHKSPTANKPATE
jgi:choline-phosphate cytidylyltransferase